MIDVVEIVQSWRNAAFPTQEMKQRAMERAKICSGCEELKRVTMRNIQMLYCGACGCPISKKTYSPRKSCPKGKWVV